jgi:hypothetical protein
VFTFREQLGNLNSSTRGPGARHSKRPRIEFTGPGTYEVRRAMVCLMAFRDFSRLGVGGLVASSLMAALATGLMTGLVTGCSTSGPPTATIIPILPEPPTTIVYPTITPPPQTTATLPPTTTTLPATTKSTLPPTTLLTAINGLVPKDDVEREVLTEMDRLFGLLKQTLYVPFEGDQQLTPIMIDPQLSKSRALATRSRRRNELSRRGATQKLRFREARSSTPDQWTVVMCEANDGQRVQTNGTSDPSDDKVIDSGLSGSIIDWTLQRTSDGWRIADARVIEKFRGSKCDA